MSAMQQAFENAGLTPRDNELDRAIAKYLNSGGTIEGAQARLNVAAARMPGMSHAARASDGLITVAQTRQPVEDVRGHSLSVRENQTVTASPSSSNRGGEGHDDLAQSRRFANAVPVREPSESMRRTSLAIEKMVSVTVFDTLKIDGRAIGDWTIGEARAAGRLKSREGAILIEASRVVANAPSNALIRNIVKPAEIQRIMQSAAETADAV